jgi:TolB-like protein
MKFFRELKRRRVLHTAWLYVVGGWIALQVVEVLSAAGLPPSTMRNLLIFLSLGFPVAVVVGWFYDITKDGISRTGPLKEGETLPKLGFIDHILMAGLVLVIAIDAYILSFPSPQESVVQPSVAQQRTIAVLDFEDQESVKNSESVGEVLAGELRQSLTRTAGLRVLGPETSKVLSLAGQNLGTLARELAVTAMLVGKISLAGDNIRIDARLLGVPNRNELWSRSLSGPASQALALQQDLIEQVLGEVAPNLDHDPVGGPRFKAGQCSTVYDVYLRGKQLSKAGKTTQADRYQRGMRLLHEAVETDENCALAWEAIAIGQINYTMPGFVKAGAAARRALELNDSLPGAWTVLAEIAEQEARWDDSEEYFLRALLVDPTNVRATMMYSETLLARGRARDALHYALEAYRFEPQSYEVNWRITLAAHYANEPDLIIKHAGITEEISGGGSWMILDSLADAYLLKGELDRALELYSEVWSPTDLDEETDRFMSRHAEWVLGCVRARDEPGAAPAVFGGLQRAVEEYKAGDLGVVKSFMLGWGIIRCAMWLGDTDLVFDMMAVKGVPPFPDGAPTEVVFMNMFHHDGGALRQDPRFREMVEESGLLDYWKRWGWADLCEPDGDSFRCN